MERKEKENSEESWVGRRILGVAAAGAVAVAAGAFLLLSSARDKDDQPVEDSTARLRKTMKAPGSGGEIIFRDKFEDDPKNYFKTRRQRGTKDDQTPEDTTAALRKTMKGPGSGGETIFRDKFNEDPKNYFKTRRQSGTKAAVDDYFQ